MKKETRLKKEANRAADFRGHRLFWQGNTGTCEHCGAWAQIDTNPAPNGIDIGGPAVAVNCQNKGG